MPSSGRVPFALQQVPTPIDSLTGFQGSLIRTFSGTTNCRLRPSFGEEHERETHTLRTSSAWWRTDTEVTPSLRDAKLGKGSVCLATSPDPNRQPHRFSREFDPDV